MKLLCVLNYIIKNGEILDFYKKLETGKYYMGDINTKGDSYYLYKIKKIVPKELMRTTMEVKEDNMNIRSLAILDHISDVEADFNDESSFKGEGKFYNFSDIFVKSIKKYTDSFKVEYSIKYSSKIDPDKWSKIYIRTINVDKELMENMVLKFKRNMKLGNLLDKLVP